MKVLTTQNKTQKITSILRRRIQSGKYSVGQKLPSSVAMAGEFGVTKETVSIAISHLVSEDIIYRKQGSGTYVLDSKSKKNKMLGVIFPGEHAGISYSSIIKGIDDISSNKGYHQLVKFSGRNTEREKECLKELIETGVDGIILYFNHPEHSKSNIDFLIKQKIPFVLIDRYFQELQTDYVGYNNFEAGYIATKYCIERGHKHIAFVSIFPLDYSCLTTRLNGYHAALREDNLDSNDYVITHNNVDDLKIKIETMLSMVNPPTAIVTNYLNEVIEAASKKNLKIPQDISIIKFGYINDPLRFFVYVDTPSIQMGKKAAEILINKIGSENCSDKYMIELKPELITGSSVGNVSLEKTIELQFKQKF